MDGAVGELFLVHGVPQVQVVPGAGLCQGGELAAVLVVGPARIVEVVAQTAVLAGADQNGLVDKGDGYGPGQPDPCRQHVQRKRGRVEAWAGPPLKRDVATEVALSRVILGGVDLVDAGGAPLCAVQLQADQVGQRTAGADQGAVPEGGDHQCRVGPFGQGQLIGADQVTSPGGVVGQEGRA